MSEKIIGYILLVVGVILIAYPTFDVYQVFTKKKEPFPLFSFPAISVDLAETITNSLPKELMQQGISLGGQKQEIISKELLNEPMNFFFHVFLMGFVASSGAKIGSLGIQMIRPIVVKLREEKQHEAGR